MRTHFIITGCFTGQTWTRYLKITGQIFKKSDSHRYGIYRHVTNWSDIAKI